MAAGRVMREGPLEARFFRLVKALGGRTWKMAPTVRGMPDRLVLLPGGRIELVELKAADGTVSPAQRVWHGLAAELGTKVTVLIGPDDVDAWGRLRANPNGAMV